MVKYFNVYCSAAHTGEKSCPLLRVGILSGVRHVVTPHGPKQSNPTYVIGGECFNSVVGRSAIFGVRR